MHHLLDLVIFFLERYSDCLTALASLYLVTISRPQTSNTGTLFDLPVALHVDCSHFVYSNLPHKFKFTHCISSLPVTKILCWHRLSSPNLCINNKTIRLDCCTSWNWQEVIYVTYSFQQIWVLCYNYGYVLFTYSVQMSV